MIAKIVWYTLQWPIALAWSLYVRLVRATSRIEIDGEEPQGAAVFVNWHRYNSFLIAFHGSRRRWFLCSPAPQLQPVARYCLMMGLRLVRGASGDRGKEAREELKEILRRGEAVFIGVDGPRGPLFKPKKGCVELSQSTGAPIVPVNYTSTRAHEFPWRWDRMLVSLPFATIRIRYGAPLHPTGTEEESLAAVEAAINDLEGQGQSGSGRPNQIHAM